VTARREDGTAGARGQLRASHADREQAIDVLKTAFVQGRLTKDEFDLRVGQALVSRTYAGLAALTADIPGWVASARPAAEPAREPVRLPGFKTAACVGAVGASPGMAFTASLLVQSSGVPAVVGVLLVGLEGLFVAGLLAALLTFLSWAVQRSRSRPAPGPPSGGPPSGPAGLDSRRQARPRPLPPARRDPWRAAEAARRRLPRAGVSPMGA
jgi:hypothetical protein